MKKFIPLLVCVIIIAFCTACGNGSPDTMTKANNNLIIYKVANETYIYNALSLFLNDNINMNSFFEEYEVKYYKMLFGMHYTVVNTDKGVVQIYFSEDGDYNYHRVITFSNDVYENNIKALKTGMSLSDVMKADPDGSYDFLYAGQSNYPQISYHYFSSGYCFAIEYSDGIIINIENFTI